MTTCMGRITSLLPIVLLVIIMIVHGRVVTSSRHITEVKQRQARLVLRLVTGA